MVDELYVETSLNYFCALQVVGSANATSTSHAANKKVASVKVPSQGNLYVHFMVMKSLNIVKIYLTYNHNMMMQKGL